MKRKALRALLATAVCVSMMGTTCLAADGVLDKDSMSNTITGNSTVENPVYKVTVPTGITFAVDPFEQKNQSQIYSEELQMINKSNVPVQVTASVKVEGGTGVSVTLVDAESKVTEADTSKNLYIAVEIASSVTETKAAAAAYSPALKKDGDGKYYDASKTFTGVTSSDATEMVDATAAKGAYTNSKKVTMSTTDTELVFALAKADYVEYYTDDTDLTKTAVQYKEVAADAKGSAVFRFCGKVNTKATWAANDLKATVKYDLIGLTGPNYTATTFVDGAHAYVATEEEPTFTPATGKITYTKGAGEIGLASITKIEASWGGIFYDVTNQFDDDGNGTLTIKAENVDTWGADSVPTKITYTNGAGTSVTTDEINVTAM